MGTVTTVHNAHWENRRRRRRYGRGSLCGAKEVIIIDGADVPTCVCVYTFIYLFLYNIYIYIYMYTSICSYCVPQSAAVHRIHNIHHNNNIIRMHTG